MAALPAWGAGAADLDLQAVEGISRDTLIALLKRKDEDVKALTSKVEMLEDKLVKSDRSNKILMEDRTSFLRFCGDLLPESGGVFEEAAAQETPVNLEVLLQRLSAWRRAPEAAGDDRSVLRRFVELVFPRDEALLRLFEGQSVGLGAFDAIQQKWAALEELRRKEVAAIDELSREQLLARTHEVEEQPEQAARDAEMREHAKQMRELSVNLNQAQKQLTLSYEQEGVLKRRIRELESSCGRGTVGEDYLKHVILKYMHYNQRGDVKAQTLVPVLCTLLSLSAEEKSAVEKSAVPAPFLFVNQAVGEAASWFRGDPESVPGFSSTRSAAQPAAPAVEEEETGDVAAAG